MAAVVGAAVFVICAERILWLSIDKPAALTKIQYTYNPRWLMIESLHQSATRCL